MNSSSDCFFLNCVCRPKAAEPLYQALTEVLREDGDIAPGDRGGYISRVFVPDEDYHNDTPQV